MQQQFSANQPAQFRTYSRNMLIALDCLGVLGILLLFIPTIISDIINANSSTMASDSLWSGPAGFGFALIYVVVVFVMVRDWRGAITLRGASKGYIFHQGQKVSTTATFMILYIIVPYIMLPIYLVRASLNYRSMKQQEAQQQKHKIATLEAELGILPPTDGTCRMCKKPLIVGAEFCQYCGATAVEHPKICPSCATTASPDAKWCPKCRTALR